MAKSVGGRPPITQEQIENVYAAIALRAPEHVAARYAGIGESTYYLYKSEGEKAREKQERGEPLGRLEKRYLEFLEGLKDAKANAIIGHLNVINNAAMNEPSWADRMLKIWMPDEFNPPQRHEITASKKIILLLKESKVTLEDVIADLGEELAREIITQEVGDELAKQLFNSRATITA